MDDTPICNLVLLFEAYGLENAPEILQLVLDEPAFQILLEGGTDFPALAVAAHSAKGVCLSVYLPAMLETVKLLERVQLNLGFKQQKSTSADVHRV
jgi:hypothetical protein